MATKTREAFVLVPLTHEKSRHITVDDFEAGVGITESGPRIGHGRVRCKE